MRTPAPVRTAPMADRAERRRSIGSRVPAALTFPTAPWILPASPPAWGPPGSPAPRPAVLRPPPTGRFGPAPYTVNRLCQPGVALPPLAVHLRAAVCLLGRFPALAGVDLDVE